MLVRGEVWFGPYLAQAEPQTGPPSTVEKRTPNLT